MAKEIGFKTPQGIVTNSPDNFSHFLGRHKNDCIIKPIFSGQIGWPEMHSVVFTSMLKTMPGAAQIETCPSYLQERIEKKYDVRVTVVGTELFAARIDSQADTETQTDWRVGEKILRHEKIALPEQQADKCRELLRCLNLQFGAIDFIETAEGEFIFLEINPNGQWAWIETQTGMPISMAIAKQLTSGSIS